MKPANQAVAKLNATGQRSADLLPYAAESFTKSGTTGRRGGKRAEASAVIGKVLRGEQPAGLIRYLYGPGRREEHLDPHIVAGWRDLAELEPAASSRWAQGLPQADRAAEPAARGAGTAKGCSASRSGTARSGRRRRTGYFPMRKWGRLARDIMHRTGLAPHGQDDEAIRWVAIRHADDHIHIVGTLARQDGTPPRFWNDYFRVREACRAAEEHYGLRRTAPGDRTAGRRPTRAEQAKARRHTAGPRLLASRCDALLVRRPPGQPARKNSSPNSAKAGVLVRTRFSVRDPGPGHRIRGRPGWGYCTRRGTSLVRRREARR